MTADDALSEYVRRHAERALLGLARFEYESGEDPHRTMTVEVVHDTRTSLRRLRATLRTFAGSFDVPGSTDDDLRFVALALGDVRDIDVVSSTLLEDLDALPDALVFGPARADLADDLASRRRRAIDGVDPDRTDARWGRAVELMAAWQQDPPQLSGQDPIKTLKAARKKARTRIRTSGGAPEALHSARKAAKRWRYAAELLDDVHPKAARHHEQATEAHQVLGALQDAVISADFLHDHARLGARSGHNGFTTGVLYARTQQRLDEARTTGLALG